MVYRVVFRRSNSDALISSTLLNSAKFWFDTKLTEKIKLAQKTIAIQFYFRLRYIYIARARVPSRLIRGSNPGTLISSIPRNFGSGEFHEASRESSSLKNSM